MGLGSPQCGISFHVLSFLPEPSASALSFDFDSQKCSGFNKLHDIILYLENHLLAGKSGE